MIPAPFEYARATSVADALARLEEGGDEARVIAGGHSLLPLMRLRLARPALLVDIGRLDELRYVEADGDDLVIGALTTHHELADSHELGEACPLLARTAARIGDPQVRHRGTLGGSIAHADPASDLPAALLALDAAIVTERAGGSREIPVSEFFVGPFTPALGPGELVTAVRVPRNDGARGAYLKFQRRAQDWAVVGVAALVEPDGGAIARASIALTNMAGTPIRATAVEDALAGAAGEEAIADAAAKVAGLADPPADEQASAEFRRHLAEVLIRRAVRAALDA